MQWLLSANDNTLQGRRCLIPCRALPGTCKTAALCGLEKCSEVRMAEVIQGLEGMRREEAVSS